VKEVEQLVYARLIADTEPANGLVALLGNVNRILHAFQSADPSVPFLTFHVYTQSSGGVQGDFMRTLEVFIQFNIFASNYADITFRLFKLFNGHNFVVPTNYIQVGQVSCIWDWEGPDGFDEQLEIQRKDVRYRFFVVPKAQNPI
jgi:hypothetical protein